MNTAPMGIRVLGIAGSLRAGSFNRALLRAAVELAPDGVSIEVFESLATIPPYNGDVEARGDPNRSPISNRPSVGQMRY